MIEIDKLSKENKKFGFKLFISYIIFTVILILTITIIHIRFSKNLVVDKFEREVQLQSIEKKDRFDKYIKTKKDAVQAIAKNEYFIGFVDNGDYKYYIDLLLLTLMESNKDYMQIRYIDEKGHEVLRFDRKNHSQNVFKINELQNKQNRYYFQEISKIKNNQVWFSDIDLNMEHGIIDQPNKPVLRVGTPLYIKDKFKGILIINIFMKELIQSITRSALYDIYLTDENGYFIKHKDSKYNWSKYYSQRTIKSDFNTKFIQKTQNEKIQSIVYNDTTYLQSLFIQKQKLNMILVEKEASKLKVESNNNNMIVTILIFSIFMSILFTFFFTRRMNGIFEIVVTQAETLRELAINLDNKVTMKTLEIAKKDRLLQNQSKLAELGDMIGNIAHQWRQPLTRLSLTLQTLSAYKKKNKMSDDQFCEAMENSLYQIEFMSNTIDNFKNFYKKDSQKSDFIIKDAIENVLNIISTVLDHSNIILSITCREDISIHANKNEFSQVLMNLIINAKDAIDEQKIENGKIDIFVFNKNNKIKIDIMDNGKGIPNCIINEIFNPYFTTKEDKGTGIGLYLSKAIIEDKMNGKLSVTNEKDGAMFTILLEPTKKTDEK
jgi:signal transduction histidine kinase